MKSVKAIVGLVIAVVVFAIMITIGKYGRAKEFNLAEKLLSEKYGEEIEVQYIYGISNIVDMREAICNPKNDRDCLFTAVFSFEKGEEELLSDSYTSRILAHNIKDDIQEKLDEEVGDCFVYSILYPDSNDFTDKGTSLKEYLDVHTGRKLCLRVAIVDDVKVGTVEDVVSGYLGSLDVNINGFVEVSVVSSKVLPQLEEYSLHHVNVDARYEELLNTKGCIRYDIKDNILYEVD